MICAIAIVSTLPPRSEAQSGPGGNSADSQPNKDRFLTGPALTFADLTKAVGAVYEDRLKAAVEKRGIAATLTEAQMAQLRLRALRRNFWSLSVSECLHRPP